MIEDTIRDIRRRCRMVMNGVASSSMRDRGLDYKLNFGVSLQKIKEIALHYSSNEELAEKLWVDQTRELKILATLLYPIETFTEMVADNWVMNINTQEIREQVCLNLFSKASFAAELAWKWIADEDTDVKASGYWLLSVLLKTKRIEHIDNLLSSYKMDVIDENTSLRNACIVALKFAGRTSPVIANKILDGLNDLEHSENIVEQEVFNSLKFEFDFYFE